MFRFSEKGIQAMDIKNADKSEIIAMKIHIREYEDAAISLGFEDTMKMLQSV